MPQFQDYGPDTPVAADKFLFYKSVGVLLKTVTLTNLATAIRTIISSFFTSSTVVPSTVPAAGKVLVGNAGGTAYAPVSIGGDVTVASTGVSTIAAGAVSYAKIQDVSAANKLIGRGSAAGSGDPQEISLGSGLTMSGTTLNATAGTGNVAAASDFGVDNVLLRADGTAKSAQATGIVVDDSDNVVIPGDVTADSLITPSIAISSVHAADDTYHGITLTGVNAGATIAQWEIVYLGAAGKWLLADADGVLTYAAVGLAVAAYVDTDPAVILVQGTVRNDAWNWSIGGKIYLSTTAGGLTQSQPSTPGDKVQRVGRALTPDIAYFNFGSEEYSTVP